MPILSRHSPCSQDNDQSLLVLHHLIRPASDSLGALSIQNTFRYSGPHALSASELSPRLFRPPRMPCLTNPHSSFRNQLNCLFPRKTFLDFQITWDPSLFYPIHAPIAPLPSPSQTWHNCKYSYLCDFHLFNFCFSARKRKRSCLPCCFLHSWHLTQLPGTEQVFNKILQNDNKETHVPSCPLVWCIFPSAQYAPILSAASSVFSLESCYLFFMTQ